jgi:amidophosphoribosyltransferase
MGQVKVPTRSQGDGAREACGVFGIWAPGRSVAPLVFDGLHALQHRGQESAGMAVSDGQAMLVMKDMGLVSQVFNDYKLASLVGHLAVGHTRYSTAGASSWHNAQPMYRNAGGTEFAVAHNGNLTNVEELAECMGMLPGVSTSDSDLMAEVLARELEGPLAGAGREGKPPDLVEALATALPRFAGAFSLLLADRESLIGVRDPKGFRPLCLGKLDDGWVLASETPALDITGAHFVREIEPGEMLLIGPSGCRSLRPWPPEQVQPKLCIFEFVYLARPDSLLYGQELHAVRVRMGELLAEQAPAPADIVIGVPDSGLPAAEGYSRRSGMPFGQGLVKNRYIGRTFIDPEPGRRALGVRRKLNPLRQAISGKRLVVVDDSIVRGTTTRAIVSMLREAGAKEVHLRISSPPYRWPCFFGLDTGTRAELVAADLEVGEVCSYVGADSLTYLSLEALKKATGVPGAGFCDACLTGHYPAPVPVEFAPSIGSPEPSPPAMAIEEGAIEEGAVENGTVEDGTVEEGAVEDGTVGPPATMERASSPA